MRNLLLLFTFALSAVWAAERPELTGTWQLDAAHSAFGESRLKAQVLVIKQDDDSIKVSEDTTEENGKEYKGQFECNTNGQECAIKSNGQALKLSAYYNGDVLVMMEQRRGSDAFTRKRMKTSEDGKTLTIEVANLGKPGQKADSLVYAKQGSPAK